MTSQVLTNGILAGLTWGLVATGFTIVYGTARFLHAAYAATFLLGAYVGLSLSRIPGVPLAACALGAVMAAVTLGLLIELLLYRPLRQRGSHGLILFLASLGVIIVVENSVALIFGSEIQVSGDHNELSSLRFLGAQATSVQCGAAMVSLTLFLMTWSFTKWSPIGKQMRAVASDPDLAESVGINTKRVITVAMVIAAALSGASGFIVAYDTSATPTMSFSVLLIGVTAAVAGGLGSIPGAMLGGLLIGIAQHVGAWLLTPQWQDGIVFAVLLIFLFTRPQGFFGKAVRKVSV